MSNNDEQTWYNVKHENGKVSVEKKGKNEINHSKNIVEYRKNTNKKRTMYIFIFISIKNYILLLFFLMFSFNFLYSSFKDSKFSKSFFLISVSFSSN